MAEEFARQHLGLFDASDFVSFSKTHSAYENLIFGRKSYTDGSSQILLTAHGAIESPERYWYWRDTSYALADVTEQSTDLIIVTAPSDEELQLAADNGVELIMQPVCWDAFIFITYKDNPVDSLTIAQIRDIYAGKITNWSEVGGEDLAIRAYSRNANSGSQTAMENLVMQGTEMMNSIKSAESVVYAMSTLLQVATARGGLGYTYKYYTFQEYSEGGLSHSPTYYMKTFAIKGIASSPDNIISGLYPFSINYYGIIRRGDEEKPGEEFLNWILSDVGQTCIRQAGYIPLNGETPTFYFDENGFILPHSSERLLTNNDLQRIEYYSYYWEITKHTQILLDFARNEIFARHGHIFDDPIYAEHYSQYEWYNALNHHYVTLDELSEIERANLQFIEEWRRY